MEADKLKKWLDIAQQFQSEQFWNQIFDEKKSAHKGNSLSLNPFSAPGEYIPKCDLYEIGSELIFEAEIPGLDTGDIHIVIHQQTLTITGEFKSLKQNCQYFLKERVNRKFKKEITLPYPVHVSNIRKEIKNGILVLFLPFKTEEVENIPINFGHSGP